MNKNKQLSKAIKIIKTRKPIQKTMSNKEFEGHLMRQTELAAVLTQRIAVLERVLLQTKNVSVEDFQKITQEVQKEFNDSVRSVIANLISRG